MQHPLFDAGAKYACGPRVSNTNEQESASLALDLGHCTEPVFFAHLRRARSEVEEAVRPYFPDGRMSFPAQAIIVTARK